MITEFHRTAVWDSLNEIFYFLFVFLKPKNNSWCAVCLKKLKRLVRCVILFSFVWHDLIEAVYTKAGSSIKCVLNKNRKAENASKWISDRIP